MTDFADQREYTVRLEWGAAGVRALAPAGTFVVVDVLSFSTCVTVAVDRGALVLPYRWEDDNAPAYAVEHAAVLAGRRGDPRCEYSLSPESLLNIRSGLRLVLPSPNGSTLALEAAQHGTVIAGCLRNRSAVAAFVERRGGAVAIIAAGERWPDGSLRPSLEDFVGAGSIIAMLTGRRSPEADGALAAYRDAAGRIRDVLARCSSGRQLIAQGAAHDVDIAADVDASASVPLLRDNHFVPAGG